MVSYLHYHTLTCHRATCKLHLKIQKHFFLLNVKFITRTALSVARHKTVHLTVLGERRLVCTHVRGSGDSPASANAHRIGVSDTSGSIADSCRLVATWNVARPRATRFTAVPVSGSNGVSFIADCCERNLRDEY